MSGSAICSRSASRRLLLTCLLVLLLGVWGATSAAAATLLNGGFDTVVPSNGTGGGWTSLNLDSAGGWRSSGGSFDEHFILNDDGKIASDPTLEQTLTDLVIGTPYRVTGLFEGVFTSFGSPTAFSFGVEIDGGPIAEFMRPMGVGVFTLDFTATSASELLRITAERNGDDSSYRVDDVAIQVIPEPSTALLLAAGLFGLGSRLRPPRAAPGGRA